jgi:hypothetical protein
VESGTDWKRSALASPSTLLWSLAACVPVVASITITSLARAPQLHVDLSWNSIGLRFSHKQHTWISDCAAVEPLRQLAAPLDSSRRLVALVLHHNSLCGLNHNGHGDWNSDG